MHIALSLKLKIGCVYKTPFRKFSHIIILQQLHDCDLGISWMKSLSRMLAWWLGFDQEAEETVRHFDICQRSCAAALLGGATSTKNRYLTNI